MPGCGTPLNIQLLVKKIRTYNKRDKSSIIYIDLKSAYNTINREKLFKIIKNKQILNDEEIEFLTKLNDSVYFKVNEKRFFFKNGVY